jgi:hypothetical protein
LRLFGVITSRDARALKRFRWNLRHPDLATNGARRIKRSLNPGRARIIRWSRIGAVFLNDQWNVASQSANRRTSSAVSAAVR